MDLVLRHVWWTYDAGKAGAADAIYHYFNLFEAGAWFVFALAVLIRSAKFHISALEMSYALAFMCFGLSDIQEAWKLTSWLIWLKLGNLIALLWLRARVIKRFYPRSKLF